MGLRFVHAGAQSPAKADFDDHLEFGVDGIRLAICVFLKAGLLILKRHRVALAALHRLIPGKVYIHLGWVTPVEKKASGPALMHSKVCLTSCKDARRLWVGSHNLSASAMGRANIEAALVHDAEQHLDECRRTAELFDPSRLQEYKQLQARKGGSIGIQEPVLVLHAEEVHELGALPAVIQVRLPTVDFDAQTKTDSPVHLFVHPRGTLRGSPVITPAVRRYSGRIIEDNRTEDHPGGGSASTMTMATHWLEFGEVPVLVAPDSSSSRPVTQAAILLDGLESRADEFLYSLIVSRARAEASSTVGRVRSETTYKAGKDCHYLGMTSSTPKTRFEQHKAGYKACRFARCYGLELMPARFAQINPRTYEDAMRHERKVAKRLKRQGHGVWQR